MPLEPILLTHAAATLFMVGLIWTVQLVHYPMFELINTSGFEAFERAHQRRISWLVGPGMTLEALSAGAICAMPTGGDLAMRAWAGIALLAVIWLSTALVQAPVHASLARAHDAGLIRLLVRSNWVRTLAWTGRAPLALSMLVSGLSAA